MSLSQQETYNLARLARFTLKGSPFAVKATWPFAVLILDSQAIRVTSRGDLIGLMKANDVGPVAREVLSRTVPPGHILVMLDAPIEGVSFVVVHVAGRSRGTVRRLRRERAARAA